MPGTTAHTMHGAGPGYTTGMALDQELEAARRAAVLAGEVALAHQRRGVSAERKADSSPVTEADRAAERVISSELARLFPDDGQLGEEGCRRDSRSGRRWIIDPLDGTRDFVRGNRQWAVQLALEISENEVVAGVCHFPALDETYWAVRGEGAFRNGDRIHVSGVKQFSDAVLCVNGLHNIAGRRFAGGLVEWMSSFWTVRSFGGSPDSMQVASGKADVWINNGAKPWDLAPARIITEEAGGVFRNFDGAASIYGLDCFTCTPVLEAEVLRFLHG